MDLLLKHRLVSCIFLMCLHGFSWLRKDVPVCDAVCHCYDYWIYNLMMGLDKNIMTVVLHPEERT